MKQVISIDRDGSLSGLQHKKGKGVDLREFGDAKIKRASEIVWDEAGQVWNVQILTGRYKGHTLTNCMWDWEVLGRRWSEDTLKSTYSLHFEDYDDAVKNEIEFLNAVRLNCRKPICMGY